MAHLLSSQEIIAAWDSELRKRAESRAKKYSDIPCPELSGSEQQEGGCDFPGTRALLGIQECRVSESCPVRAEYLKARLERGIASEFYHV
jgi:hypothetical protein